MTPEEADKLRFWLKEVVYAPQYAGRIISAVPALLTSLEACQSKDQELAKEFRRLAADHRQYAIEEAREGSDGWSASHQAVGNTWEQAAQMLEERLNGA